MLYLHEVNYLVVLRKKNSRLEFVTAYTKNNKHFPNERHNHQDPREIKAEAAIATSEALSTLR